MVDSQVTDPVEPNGDVEQKRFGRTQKIAVLCFLAPFSAVVLPAITVLIKAIKGADTATQLAVLDRLKDFAGGFCFNAVLTILIVAGALKGIPMAANAIATFAQRKADPGPEAP
jgi:hypothetical protein